MKQALVCVWIGAWILCAGCTPRITVIDRHTVMEEAAAGEWPDFERDLLPNATEKGPVPFRETGGNDQKKKLYNVLNGEMTSTSGTATQGSGK